MVLCKDCKNHVTSPGRRWCDRLKMYLYSTTGCSVGDSDEKEPNYANVSIYDQEEVHPNCTVQIWRNSVTGQTSIGWWDNESDGEES